MPLSIPRSKLGAYSPGQDSKMNHTYDLFELSRTLLSVSVTDSARFFFGGGSVKVHSLDRVRHSRHCTAASDEYRHRLLRFLQPSQGLSLLGVPFMSYSNLRGL